jgi:hypothetical protein
MRPIQLWAELGGLGPVAARLHAFANPDNETTEGDEDQLKQLMRICGWAATNEQVVFEMVTTHALHVPAIRFVEQGKHLNEALSMLRPMTLPDKTRERIRQDGAVEASIPTLKHLTEQAGDDEVRSMISSFLLPCSVQCISCLECTYTICACIYFLYTCYYKFVEALYLAGRE